MTKVAAVQMVSTPRVEDNLVTAEVFNKAEATYFEQQIRKTELQRNLNVVKLELEEMIGVSFDELVNKK